MSLSLDDEKSVETSAKHKLTQAQNLLLNLEKILVELMGPEKTRKLSAKYLTKFTMVATKSVMPRSTDDQHEALTLEIEAQFDQLLELAQLTYSGIEGWCEQQGIFGSPLQKLFDIGCDEYDISLVQVILQVGYELQDPMPKNWYDHRFTRKCRIIPCCMGSLVEAPADDEENKRSLLKVLLEYGKPPGNRVKYGLRATCQRYGETRRNWEDRTECIRMLLDYGSRFAGTELTEEEKDDLYSVSYTRVSCGLQKAVLDDDVNSAREFIAKGADPTECLWIHQNGCTNRTWWRFPQSGEMMRTLLEGGADPNYDTRHGYTPLHYCCMVCYPFNKLLEVVQALLEFGANPHLPTRVWDYWTPLESFIERFWDDDAPNPEAECPYCEGKGIVGPDGEPTDAEEGEECSKCEGSGKGEVGDYVVDEFWKDGEIGNVYRFLASLDLNWID